MCRVLSVKPSSYYDWLSRDISEQQVHRNQCELLVKAAHSEMKERYGVDRLHAHLSKQGHNISLYMVRSIKEEHGIKCRRHKRFKVTTDSNHNKLVYDNVLDQRFDAKRPNEAWVSDITYIWTAEGWLYLAGVKDLYTKELVGYAINKRMTADLVCRALNMAIKNKRPTQGLIVHSDRGSQYCSHAYHKIIEQHKFTGSMSGKGNCYDNAPIESFWGVLKNELGCVDIYRIIDNHSVMTRLTLSDAQWAKIAPYCAGKETDVGRTAVNNRLFIEAVLWIVRTGSPWRDLPPEFGNWNSVYKRYRRWVKSDRFSKLFNALNDSDLEYAMIDGTIVKVHRHGQGAKGGLVIR